MSNSIFSNPLMWQRKKTTNDTQDEGFEFNFEEAFSDFEKEKKEFQEQSSMADSAAKAAEYKETTPQMVGNNPPATGEDQKQKNKDTNNDATDARSLASSNLDSILSTINSNKLPSLEDLLNGVTQRNTYINIRIDSDIFNDDEEADIIIANKLGITAEYLFERGTQAGLSPFQIIDNLNIIRCSVALEKITDDKLDSQDLNNLYIASLNNDTDAVGTILANKNITLGDGFTTNDILELSQTAHTPIFKSVYLN